VSTLKPKKAPYHHGDLREALLSAALAILEEGEGVAGLSLREAARRAGVSAMAPYRHFADKEALLAAVATIGFERLGKALAAADADSDSKAALNAQGVSYVAFACAQPALFRLMFGTHAPTKCGALGAAADVAFHLLADRVAAQAPPALTMPLTLASWALVHGLAMLAVDGQLAQFGASPVSLAEQVTALAFNRVSEP
jgi:AcrR family transcriptional regulator